MAIYNYFILFYLELWKGDFSSNAVNLNLLIKLIQRLWLDRAGILLFLLCSWQMYYQPESKEPQEANLHVLDGARQEDMLKKTPAGIGKSGKRTRKRKNQKRNAWLKGRKIVLPPQEEQKLNRQCNTLPTLHTLLLSEDEEAIKHYLGAKNEENKDGQEGGGISNINIKIKEKNSTGATALHMCALLRGKRRKAIVNFVVDTIVDKDPTLLWDQAGFCETVLHVAARCGSHHLIEAILQKLQLLDNSSYLAEKGSLLDIPNDRGQTALHLAARYIYATIPEHLPFNKRWCIKFKFLLVMVRWGHYKCCMALITYHAGIDYEDHRHKTALDLANQNRHHRVGLSNASMSLYTIYH